MADKEAESLEDRLKLGFDCSALCSLDQRNAELRLDKKSGMELYLQESYEQAKTCFLRGAEKTDAVNKKEDFYKWALDCSKQILRRHLKAWNNGKVDAEFKKVCNLYETVIKTHETADNYLDYIEFLGNEMIDNHKVLMLEEALRVAEIAAESFPEDARIHAALHDLYTGIGKKEGENYPQKAYESMVAACKLEYDDPNFIIGRFGTEILASAPNNKKPATVPLIMMLKYKDRIMMTDENLLYRYGNFTLKTKGRPALTLAIFKHAYGLNPHMAGLKEKVAEAYNNAIGSAKDPKHKAALENDFEEFCKKTGIIKVVCETCKEEETPKLLPAVHTEKKSEEIELKIPKIMDVKQYLDERIIGQENAKIIMAVALRNHFKRVKYNREHPKERMEKDNIIFLGPTGSGKTHTARTLAEIAGLPFAEFDSTSITAHGYVGRDAEDCVTRLYYAAGCNILKTQIGFIFMDEVDKIAANNSSNGIDVNGAGAQNSLMKIMEGCKVEITVASSEHQKQLVTIDTSDILFILGGAFSGTPGKDSLSSIREERSGKSGMGFKMAETKSNKKGIKAVTDADLQKYGFMPEFCGRVPLRALFDPLSKEQLKRVLVEPKNSILRQKQKNFELDGIKLTMDEGAMDLIAEKAYELNAGARSLRTIINTVLLVPEFELPDSGVKSLIVDRKYVEKAIEGIDFEELRA
ncbi:MAG: AAA family ATPase [Nanoarchaeota archaeon]